MKILELYSGIGGMHMAFNESNLPGGVKVAIEINTTSISIYKHNFPNTKVLNFNIEGLTADTINKFDVDTILMSPPCQPFTRNGNQADINDKRTASFQHVLNLLPELNVKYILVENVKGFEKSKMRDILTSKLKENEFLYQEFILSPSQFGVPNSRHRYYCLAKKTPFLFENKDIVLESIPGNEEESACSEIKDILDKGNFTNYYLPDNILSKRLGVIDICYAHSKRSCCFTKAYGRYIEGTGSVFTEKSESFVKKNLEMLKTMDKNSKDYLQLAKTLQLRFFTPKEVSRLLSFPETFSFPEEISDRQKFMVLGNSINVKVVSKLIKLLN